MKPRVAAFMLLSMAAASGVGAQGPAPDADGISKLLTALERAIVQGDPREYAALFLRSEPSAGEVPQLLAAPESGITRAAVRERDRVPLPDGPDGTGFRLIVEVLREYGPRATVAMWRLDVRRGAAGADPRRQEWLIADQQQLSLVDGLHRLALNPEVQYGVRNLVVRSEDLTLALPSGVAFMAEADGQTTALVLLGRGEMTFAPAPPAEREQVRLFSGEETLRATFDAAFIRIPPGALEWHASPDALRRTAVDARALRRAQSVFGEYVTRSFVLDLNDLSSEVWSLTPTAGDFLGEIETDRYDTLTYARSTNEAEDVTLFDRQRKKNIAIYASAHKLAVRGRFYNEDELTDYDVLDYDVRVAFTPETNWLEGEARLRVRVRAFALATMTIRLAEPLQVKGIVVEDQGRALSLRVRGQNSVVTNLPTTLARGDEFTLRVVYAGQLAPQPLEREALVLAPQRRELAIDAPIVLPEPQYIYSTRAHWYPQATVSDYATATLHIEVPAAYSVIASGAPAPSSPQFVGGVGPLRRRFTFTATQPLRYLACIISRFVLVGASSLALPADRTDAAAAPADGARDDRGTVVLAVEANPRQVGRGRDLSEQAAEILSFYASLVGDAPYDRFTLALVDSDLPGGHSPAYFAILNQPLPTSPFVWRNDPVNFDGFPRFFLAHELAHQWWGQAVGWKNYHEQWLSEGLAQYFAALYAERQRGPEVFTGILRQMRRWAIANSDQGPVYLGYRLGHIKGEGRIFRAIIYNKSALVMHMLRRLVGDDAFFRGLRRFYTGSRFKKAGTQELQAAFEAETGRSLERFFERWIFESGFPRLAFDSRVEASGGGPGELVVRFEQSERIFDVPVTVTLTYANQPAEDVVIPVTDRVVETRIPLKDAVRSVDVNRDFAALAEVEE
jgi:hypothetical protein